MSSSKGLTLRWSLGLRLVLVFTLIAAATAAKHKDPERKALYRLEYIDIQKVLENNRMLTNFIRCFLRQGPCTPEARDFRKLLPKLAGTMCADCTPKQRIIIKKVFNHLMENRPKEWQSLLDRFDPQRKYSDRLHTFMSGDPEFPYQTTSIPTKSELIKRIEMITIMPSFPSERSDNSTKSPILLNNTGSENATKSDS